MNDEQRTEPQGNLQQGREGASEEPISETAKRYCEPSGEEAVGIGAEFLIAQWEARAAQCEETAEQFRTVTQTLLCSYLEKARAYRACVADLRRHHKPKR